jgi:hypothetical protein
MESIVAFLNALAAIPKILSFVEWVAQGVSYWYIQRQTASTLQEISDAAAFSARATNQTERLAALARWRTALSRPRVS